MFTAESLAGNEISWINFGKKSYTTNFGQVVLDEKTDEFRECCIGLGRNQGNTEISIKIFDGEFQITKDTFNTVYAELCSKDFPYPKKPNQTIEIVEVLKILQKDDNDSIAAIIVKKEIVKLMYQKLHFGKAELIALEELLASWRKPITKEDLNPPKREPIVERTPIIQREPIKAKKSSYYSAFR